MKEKIRYLPDCEMKSAFQKVRFRPLTKGSGREFRALCRTIKGFEKWYNIWAKSSAEEQHILSYAKALEQVRPGGENRLPNNAFRANAGTDGSVMNNKTKQGGLGIVSVLTIIFVVLKLLGVIKWSWIWVLSPIWISAVIMVAVFSVIQIDGRIKKGKW